MNRNVTALILLVLAVGVYMTVTKGLWGHIQAIQTVNNTYTEAIDNANKLISIRDQVLADYNALSAEDQDRLNKMLPTAVDNIRLIIDLNSIAVKRGLTLRGIDANTDNQFGDENNSSQPSAVIRRASPGLSTVTVSFTTSASYQQFIQFMRDLEANLRLMDISHLSIKANNSNIYDYSVELKTYWFSQ